ncbi:ATP-binding protein [Jannaschia sp. Os4]|nr:ATP-binding protein [Jannaschia sp. Os4]
MPNGPFIVPISDLTGADIDRLVYDGIPEGAQVDFNQDLSEKSGGLSGWRRGERNVSEKAIRELCRMTVGFANTDGGTLVVGIRETEDHPSRAEVIDPLPAVAELADRVRRSLLDRIDPPLDRVEVAGIVTDGDAGALVIRTPPSLNAPHSGTAQGRLRGIHSAGGSDRGGDHARGARHRPPTRKRDRAVRANVSRCPASL